MFVVVINSNLSAVPIVIYFISFYSNISIICYWLLADII